MKLGWNFFLHPMPIPRPKRAIACSLRNGFLQNMPSDLKQLVDKMPRFKGVPAFHAALAGWGIDEVYAGNADAHFLGDNKAASEYAQKFIKAVKKPPADYKEMSHDAKLAMRDFVAKLTDSFKNTGMSIFLSNDTPAIYFLTDADSYILFRCLGTNTTIEYTKSLLANCILSKVMKELPNIGDEKSLLSRELISLALEHLRECDWKCPEKFMKLKGFHPVVGGIYDEDPPA